MNCIFRRQPVQPVVAAFLEAQRSCQLTYEDVGCTQQEPPEGFDCDHYRVALGKGPQVFAAARQAIATWHMFPRDWTRVIPAAAPIDVGLTVAVLIKAFGMWWLNSARVVYMIDEPERRFGFAYGTLPGHIERGEERFLIERDEQDAIWYDLRAMSRPRHWMTRVGYPLARHLQRRFARDSQRAMLQIAAGTESATGFASGQY